MKQKMTLKDKKKNLRKQMENLMACSTNGGRIGMHIGYWWESQKERDHWEEQDVGGWTILK
jgi:hypothetical protein